MRTRALLLATLMLVLAAVGPAGADEAPAPVVDWGDNGQGRTTPPAGPAAATADTAGGVSPETNALDYPAGFEFEPLGIIGWPWERQYSLGVDRWEVFLCKPSAGGLSLDTLMTQISQSGTSEYFSWWSHELYTITFTAGAEIITADADECEPAVYEQASGTFNGAIIAHTYPQYFGAAGSAGWPCPEGTGLCPAEGLLFPANSRTVWMRADSFTAWPGVVEHELGHTLGFPHSFSAVTDAGFPAFNRYDNPVDVMSTAGVFPKGTNAVNRYAAGWIAPDQVYVFNGEPATIWLAAHGAAGYEMIVVPEGQLGVFFSLDARVRHDQYDALVQPAMPDWTGIEVYRIDQRRDVCGQADLPPGDPFSSLPCSGTQRLTEIQPVAVYGGGNALRPANYMLQPGDRMIVGSAAVEVLGREGDRYEVRLSPHHTVTCQGLAATIVGTSGPQTLTGTSRSDIIAGLGGDDIIYGLGGNDIICGGAGSDLIYGGPGHDRLIGGSGSDRILGQGGFDTIDGGGVADRLYGGDLGDRLWGSGGNDRLFGQAGDDRLVGGSGSDRLVGGAGNDHCYGGDCEWDFGMGG